MKEIIHKSLTSKYNLKQKVLCNKTVEYKQTSYLWNKVNCKNCLKKCPNYNPKRIKRLIKENAITKNN